MSFKESKQEIGNLLSMIHGDGGHYIGEHGWEKAARDAQEILNRLHVRVDYLESRHNPDRAALEVPE